MGWVLEIYRRSGPGKLLLHRAEGFNLKGIRKAFFEAIRGDVAVHELPRHLEYRVRWEGEIR